MRLWLCAIGIGVAALGLGPQAAQAQWNNPCVAKFQGVMADLRAGIAVPPADVRWALEYEKNSSQCNLPQAAARPAAPVGTPVPSRAAAQAAATPAPPLPNGWRPPVPAPNAPPMPVNYVQGNVQCSFPIRLDIYSASPCDQFAVAMAFLKGQSGFPANKVQAIHYVKLAALAGHATAQMGYAEALDNGSGGLTKDPRKAFLMALQAANQGHVDGMDWAARGYYSGSGTTQSYPLAAQWFQKAAATGHVRATTTLGSMYFYGDGVAKDPARGVNMFRYSAERGDAWAQLYLGDAYRTGVGAPFDVAQARVWLNKAAGQGNAKAREVLAYMAQVDRNYANAPRSYSSSGGSYGSTSSGPSLSEQAMETFRRQGRENCAAAAKGASRICNVP